MLDECKGEKFEEVISTFALVVVKKVLPSQHPALSLGYLERLPEECLMPLILAYRNSLRQNLRQRRDISNQANRYAKNLALEQADLQQRQHDVQEGFQQVAESELVHLSTVVKNTWMGDERWCDVLLEGRRHFDRSVPQQSFEESWAKSLDHRSPCGPKTHSLITELNERIAKQEKRWKKWKTFHASLRNAQAAKKLDFEPSELSKPFSLGFDQHQDLRLDSQTLQAPGTAQLEPYHASILKNMENDLLVLTRASPLNFAPMARPGESQLKLPGSDHNESQSSSLLLLPEMAAPREPQAEPPGNNDEEIQSQSLPSPSEMGTPWKSRAESPENNLDESLILPTFKLLARSPNFPAVTPENDDDEPLPNLNFAHMAAPLEPQGESPESQDEDESECPPLPDLGARPGTLLERTRQSMSLLSNPPRKSSRQSRARQPRFSETYPVNQFETRGKAQPRSGSSTPRDKLFSDEADYASVFKSRPRIAVSPLLSPERSKLGLDSVLAEDADTLNLGDEMEDTPSRARVRQGR